MKTPPRQPRTKAGELPQIRKNSRGSLYMNFHGRRYYFGRVSLVEAEKERLRIIAEHEAVGTAAAVKKADVTVAILVRDFLVYAKSHYAKNGRSTGTYERYCVTVQPLLELYAATPVPEFGPKSLMTVREKMLHSGRLCRNTINERIGYIKYIFLWGVQHELVDEDVKARLYAVEGIEEGKEGTYDYDPIPPVEFEVVQKTLPHCPHPIISDMAWVQMYGGMRPQDVCNMRLCDIDRTKEVWEYAPWEHKTQHRMKKKQAQLGRPEEKLIRWLGPKAQEILAPYATAKASMPEAFLFSPADAVRLLEIEKRMSRKSKVQPSQVDRSKPHPMIRPGEKYATGSYRTAIQRTVDKINRAEEKAAKKEGREPVLLPRWAPNQLRHTWATYIAKIYDLETAQLILGHKHINTTLIYAERDKEKAREAALKHG